MKHPVPQAAITFNESTGLFGFSVWFEGKRPHYAMETFASEEAALQYIDPHNERVWEDASPADTGVVKISRAFKAGSVADRMQQ